MANDYSNPSEGHGLLIREMAEQDRPREKAMQCGIKSLSDAELMAILFGTGIKGKSVVELCREILADHEYHLGRVARQPVQHFTNRYKGIGAAKAISLLAALELGSRAASDAVREKNKVVTSPEVAADIMRHHFSNIPVEQFWVMLLAQNGAVIKEICVAQGGLTATVVDIKVILKAALDHYACALIAFHNHPSGNLKPSPQDDALTKRIADGCRAIDVRLHDHIIVTDSSYYSYHDNGRLP